LPTITKRDGRYRAQVRKRGVAASATFRTKVEASRWAAQLERDLEDRRLGRPTRHTWRDAVDRYRKTVSIHKRSASNEDKRLNRLLRVDFVDRPLADIRSDDWVQWREALQIQRASINRTFNLVRHIYRYVTREWGWLPRSPMEHIKDYPEPSHRKLVWSADNQRAMLDALGGVDRGTVKGRVAAAFLFALETGMRAGEICALRRSDITGPVATLRQTKNGEIRQVPMAPKALQILETLGDDLFDLTPARLDAVFRKYKPDNLKHLRFHDTRHTAATRIGSGGKLTVMEMCAVFGWKDPRQSLTYFNPSAADLAARLA
jgi:integrase